MGKAKRLPDEFQRGVYKKQRGKTIIVGAPYRPSSSSAPYQQPAIDPPAVPLRHYGAENDSGVGDDYLMHLDPTLPTEEEVRAAYGNVLNSILFLKLCSLLNRLKMIICGNGYRRDQATWGVFCLLKGMR
jgi:hypothetical protein